MKQSNSWKIQLYKIIFVFKTEREVGAWKMVVSVAGSWSQIWDCPITLAGWQASGGGGKSQEEANGFHLIGAGRAWASSPRGIGLSFKKALETGIPSSTY